MPSAYDRRKFDQSLKPPSIDEVDRKWSGRIKPRDSDMFESPCSFSGSFISGEDMETEES